MKAITVTSANRLKQTNEYLEFLIAAQFLLNVCKKRQDAENPLIRRKMPIESKLLSEMPYIPELARDFRDITNPWAKMKSRTDTEKAIAECLQIMWVVPAVEKYIRSKHDAGKLHALENDPFVLAMLQDLNSFGTRYMEWAEKDMGGILRCQVPNPHDASLQKKFEKTKRQLAKLFRQYDIWPLVNYFQSLIRCCYDSNLQCWWAPVFLLQEDFNRWSGLAPASGSPSGTPDGALGPVFAGSLAISVRDTKARRNLSYEEYLEWQLVSMSEKRLKKLIKKHAAVREYLRSKGYHHATEWNPVDFEMLYERLCLQLSPVKIAARCPKCQQCHKVDPNNLDSPATIKDRTDKIAKKLLDLEIPRAKYKDPSNT